MTSRSFTNALALGLALGLLAGGVTLLVLASRSLGTEIDCGALSMNECALAQELATGLGRRQGMAGMVLSLASLATFLSLWVASRR